MTPSEHARDGILLLNPPFTDSRGPYVAIPQLAAYLKQKGIPVAAADLNAGFLQRFLTPGAIARGAVHVKERFRQLNDAGSLSLRQMIEYNLLLRVLREYPALSGTVNWLSTPFADFQDIRESEARGFLMCLASMPYFPEVFMADHKFISPGRYSCFSSRQLLESAAEESRYTELFRQEIERVWPSPAPRLVGFSVAFSHQIVPAFQMAAVIRRMDPGVHITMGGPSISIFFRDLKNPALFALVDSLVMDDGEIPLEQLYHALGRPPAAVHAIAGVICRKDGQVSMTPPAPPLGLTDLPAPDLGVFDLDGYLAPKERILLPVRFSRGCSWKKCAFCRTRHPLCRDEQEPDADYLFETLRRLYQDQGLRNFFFSTESANPALLEQVCRRTLAAGMSIEWVTHTRVSRELSRQRCALFTAAGCRHMAVGVESMSDRVLQLMRKGISVSLVHKVLETIAGAMPLTAYMMVGFPSETHEEALATHAAISRLKQAGLLNAFSYSMFVLQQGAEIHANPSAFGITALEHDPDEDLNPDIAGFSGSGMSREQAFELYLRYVREHTYSGSSGPLREIAIDGRKLALRHDPQQMRQAFGTQWRMLVKPFARWVEDMA
jgi:hypothetical protein